MRTKCLRFATFMILLMSVAASAAVREVTIYTRFAHLPSALSIEAMKAELDAIMVPLDLRFDWRSLQQAAGHRTMDALVVVTFDGACQAGDLLPAAPQRGALGWTHVTDGEILPFMDVDCNRIRDLLSHPFETALPPARERLLGRAMARVLAHELYHFLMHTSAHASSGIAKASYTGADLACAQLRFEQTQLRVIPQTPR